MGKSSLIRGLFSLTPEVEVRVSKIPVSIKTGRVQSLTPGRFTLLDVLCSINYDLSKYSTEEGGEEEEEVNVLKKKN